MKKYAEPADRYRDTGVELARDPADTGAGRDIGVEIEICTSTAHPGWLRLRCELWSHETQQAHLAEMASFLAEPHRFVQFVARDRNGNGVGLVEAIADWARSRGLHELASDVPIDNLVSQAVHEKLGFTETERVVFYRKPIA